MSRRRAAAIARPAALAMAALAFTVSPAPAQSMMNHLDFASPEMTQAEMSREEVAAMLAAATPAMPADFSPGSSSRTRTRRPWAGRTRFSVWRMS
jgi:hypothetical protein